MFGNAFFKSCGCDRGMCTCGPKLTKSQIEERDLKSEMKHTFEDINYKIIKKDHFDNRKHNISVMNRYNRNPEHNRYFVREVTKPTVEVTIDMVIQIHEIYKRRKHYSIGLLNKVIGSFQDMHSPEESREINDFFKKEFEYTVVRTHWER